MQTSRERIQSADEAICHRSEKVLVPRGNTTRHEKTNQSNDWIKRATLTGKLTITLISSSKPTKWENEKGNSWYIWKKKIPIIEKAENATDSISSSQQKIFFNWLHRWLKFKNVCNRKSFIHELIRSRLLTVRTIQTWQTLEEFAHLNKFRLFCLSDLDGATL